MNDIARDATVEALGHALMLGHRWIDAYSADLQHDPEGLALIQRVIDGAPAEISFPLNTLAGQIELRVQDAAGNWQPLIVEAFEIEDLGDAPQAASA
jgi:hypothetical protein